MSEPYTIGADRLRRSCDPEAFAFKTTRQVEPLDEVIGQERAVEAIEFGLKMPSAGYNIFVTGQVGSGRTTICRDIVSRHARTLPAPDDWVLVHNFSDPYRPAALPLPAGQAPRFARAMGKLVSDLRRELPKALRTKAFHDQQAEVQETFERRKEALFQELRRRATALGLAVNRTNVGYQTIALVEGQPVTQEAFEALPEADKARIRNAIHHFQAVIESTEMENQKLLEAEQQAVDQLTREAALFVIRSRFGSLRKAYGARKGVSAYLDAAQDDVLDNVEAFLPAGNSGAQGPESVETAFDFGRYSVNVLSSSERVDGAPVVFEPNPTYTNLFGQIEKRLVMGQLQTDFTQVKGGALLRANGGFLIIEIESALGNPHVWEALKRALQTRRLAIEDIASDIGFGTASLRPSPIPLDVKVVLLGGHQIFEMLQNNDSKFDKLFKVRADFDWEVERTAATADLYASFISRVCREEGLLPFSPPAVAAIVEVGQRLVAHQGKLSLRFGSIVDCLMESDHWARSAGATRVSRNHVETAVTKRRFRYNLYEEKLRESLIDDTVHLDLEGEVTGQVNGLAVYQIGDLAFGRPSRITAEIFLGRPGVVSIEREVRLSGRTHDKGVLILSGYLGATFAQRRPLSVSVTLAFEQSYGEIEGDSASSTELYAILSRMADLPVRQGIAVTGSVDQKGRIQAVGGVNEKIEGFFDVCYRRGLTGRQGVVIPASNAQNLMLKPEVVDAVRAGRFRIFGVGSVEEGIEILTGLEAGRPGEDGSFPPGTVFGRVQERLEGYHRLAMESFRHPWGGPHS